MECSITFNIKPDNCVSKALRGGIAVRGKDHHGDCSDRCPWFEGGTCLAAELYQRAAPVSYFLFRPYPELRQLSLWDESF